MGLLDGIDPSALQGALGPDGLEELRKYNALMQPSQSTIEQAKKDRLVNFGLGLMGARKGQEWATIGQSGLNAQGGYNKDIAAQQAMQGQNVSQAMQMMGIAKANQGLQVDADLQKKIAAVLGGGGIAAPQGPQLQNMGPGGPTPANAAAVAPPPQAAPSPDDGVRARAAQYRQLADVYSGGGAKYAEQFKKYADAADALEKQLEYNSEPRTVMKDGKPTLAMFNKSGGSKETAYAPAVPIHFQDTGGGYQGINSLTGAPLAGVGGVKTATPGEKMSNSLGYANLAESKRAHNLQYGLNEDGTPNGNLDALAKGVANYDIPFPTTMMYRRPEMGAEVLAKAQALNPTYDAKNYPVAQASMTAFAKGKQGDTVRFIGNVLQHGDVLKQAAAALNNGDYPLLNRLANAVGTQAGSSAPATYNAIKDIYANEVVKAVVGSGGGVGDREKSQKVLADFSNPATVAGVTDGYQKLMAGQLVDLQQQYKAGTQKDDFADRFLTPRVKELLTSGTSGATGPARISSEADYAKLPKGAQYMAPDGSIRTKQ